jgi:predicted ribosome quality control (RQC) complex YloA/Tae2 family protein
MFEHREDFKIRDIELLKSGRHIRIDEKTKIVVGRNRKDNAAIRNLSEGNGDIVIEMKHFPGPVALVPCGCDEETLARAASICALYSDAPDNEDVIAECKMATAVKLISTKAAKREDVKELIL